MLVHQRRFRLPGAKHVMDGGQFIEIHRDGRSNILCLSAFSRKVSERSLDRWNVRGLHSCTHAVVWAHRTKLWPHSQFDRLNGSESQFFKLNCPCEVIEVVVKAAVVLVWKKQSFFLSTALIDVQLELKLQIT
jgi:hypothetical protein